MELVRYCKIASSWWASRELYTQMKLAIPITLTLALQQLPIFLSLLFVGWIKVEEDEQSSLNLNAAALGTSMFNITAGSAFIGLSSAADTLISQTYGFGNYKRVGVIFQRGLLISLLATLFIVCFPLNTENLLLLCQQDPCVARQTAVYVRILILGYPFFALYIMLQKFLQAQSIVWPFILTGLLTNGISVGAHSLFIFGLGLGVEGAATALVITMVFQPLLLIAYIKIRKLHKKTWTGWGIACLEEWPEYLKLAIPGTIMISAEWSGYEIIQIVLGIVSTVELAVSGILSSYVVFVFMIPYSFSVAVSIRVGNELGKGNVLQAKRVIRVAMFVMTVITVTVLSVTFGLRTHFGELYNANQDVQDKLDFAVYAVCAQLFGDQIQGFLAGIVRGAGHQLRGAIVNQVAYYVLGLPVGIGIGVGLDLGALGVWIGLAIASNVQAVCIGIILLSLNWDKEAQLAMKRGAGRKQFNQVTNDEGNQQINNTDKTNGSDSGHIELVQVNHSADLSCPVDTIRITTTSDEDQQWELVELSNSTAIINNQAHSITNTDTSNAATTSDEDQQRELEEIDLNSTAIVSDEADLITNEDTLDVSIDTGHSSNASNEHKSFLLNLRTVTFSQINYQVPHLKLLLIHLLVVVIAIVCLVSSGLISMVQLPETLKRSSNYTQCANITE